FYHRWRQGFQSKRCSRTLRLSRARKPERRRSGGWRASAAGGCSSKPLTRQEYSLSLRRAIPSTMSSFSHGQPLTSRRGISYEPPASTNACASPPQWQGRPDAGTLCPGSPPAGPVLPHTPRPPLGTGAAALLPPPPKRRRPCPNVSAPLLQRHPLLLS